MHKYSMFYKSYDDIMEDLSDLEQLAMYRAITKYGLYEEEPNLTGLSKTMWKMIKPLIDANHENSNNGKKGGRPPKKPVSDKKEETNINNPKEEEKPVKATKKPDEITEYAHKKSNFVKNFWSNFGDGNYIFDDERIFFDEDERKLYVSGSDDKPKYSLKHYQDRIFDSNYIDDC